MFKIKNVVIRKLTFILLFSFILISGRAFGQNFDINGISPGGTISILNCSEKLHVNLSVDVSGFGKATLELYHNGVKIKSKTKRFLFSQGRIIWFTFVLDPLPGNYHAVFKIKRSVRETPLIKVNSNCPNLKCLENSFGGFMDSGDRALIADVNNDDQEDLVLINTGYSGTAIRVINLEIMADIKTMNHGTLGGFLDAKDKSFIADVNGDGRDDLVLFNTGGSGTALRVIDLKTMGDISSMSYSTLGGGWNDSNDRALIADVNNDDQEELVLINTGYTGTAIRVINLETMADIKTMNHGTLGGFLDAKDKSFIADANGDGRDDLVLFNTGGSGTALRVIDLKTMGDISSMSYSTLGGGWNDSGDRALIADVNNNAQEELVLINTGYSGTAIRVINLETMADIKTMNHGTLGGFLDAKDKSFIADANGDGRDDLVLFNTGGSGTALRVIDLKTMGDISSMSYSTLGGGWNDSNDRALIANVSNNAQEELVLINTGYTGTAIRVINLETMADISTISHCEN